MFEEVKELMEAIDMFKAQVVDATELLSHVQATTATLNNLETSYNESRTELIHAMEHIEQVLSEKLSVLHKRIDDCDVKNGSKFIILYVGLGVSIISNVLLIVLR